MAESYLTVVAELTAKPGREDDLRSLLMSVIEPVRAEEGCIQYDLARQHEGSRVVRLLRKLERWGRAEEPCRLGTHESLRRQSNGVDPADPARVLDVHENRLSVKYKRTPCVLNLPDPVRLCRACVHGANSASSARGSSLNARALRRLRHVSGADCSRAL